MDLYKICRGFVDDVNSNLSEPSVVLDPPAYSLENFNDTGPNLFQINIRGRLLQIEFESTDQLYSNEDFRRPYVLRGFVRAFNQESLDHHIIDEQLVFCCPKADQPLWYFFDSRTYRSGVVRQDYLITEMERLI
jgi:hypothetical protein